ncbi:NUMOD4 motif-containing HNH endonuclease [Achromobacter xylosoxidans]
MNPTTQQPIWRDVVGFEEFFQVSNTGEIYSKRSERVLKQATSRAGYRLLTTRLAGKKSKAVCFRVHRLVAAAFLPPPSPEIVAACAAQGFGAVLVRHLDGDKTNNRPENLAWGTYKDNSMDFMRSAAFGPYCRRRSGAKAPSAKLTDSQVAEIRARYRRGSRLHGARAIAKELGLSHTNVAKVARGVSYVA